MNKYILLIARGIPTEKYPLLGLFEFDQAKALADMGYNIVFMAVDLRSIRRFRKWGYESYKKDSIDIRILNIPCGRVPVSILYKMMEWCAYILYKKINKEFGKPFIIHAHFAINGYIAYKLKIKENIPVIITEHASEMLNKSSMKKDFYHCAYLAYNNADKVIAVSKYLASALENNFGINPIVIHNMIDSNNFYYKERKNSDVFKFISIGSLIENKRMNLLAKSFLKEFSKNENVELYIIGGGIEKENLERVINDDETGAKVKLLGELQRESITQFLSESDCFVLLSVSETFGVVYAEAMATGLPVIATKCGGPEEFVNENNGILISIDNEDEVRKAMRYIYENIDNYDKRNISREIIDKFSTNKIVMDLKNIYDDISN